MAEEKQNQSHEYDATATNTEAEIKDRGLFDFLGNKKEEEKPQEEVIATEFDNKAKLSNEPHINLGHQHQQQQQDQDQHQDQDQQGDKKQTLLEKLHRSTSSSSSSSDEEQEGEGGEKKKKKKEKKGLKEKIGGDDHKEENKEEDTAVPVEKVEVEAAHPNDEKKGFLDKIKDKLPGQHKKPEEVPPTSSEYVAAHSESKAHDEEEAKDKEKKGLLDKIKEKLPGYHPKPNEDKEKESDVH
ncbi:dehydrin COR47-like [Abrus precatorius]|uniref:Dehydrin COR47-like n=1 Tax=Abrus precatorius TaxID=3816 RepID=A0A8B8JDL8_ABRPR|nr:dehydrin COR47-like [Abrus precatorius]